MICTTPIVQEAGWASGLVWMGLENLPPPVCKPRTVQPVVSCYMTYASMVPHTLIQCHYTREIYYTG